MKKYWRSGSTAPCVLIDGGELYTRGKGLQYPLYIRLGEPQNRSGYDDEEKKSHLSPCRELNPGPLCQLQRLYTVKWDNIITVYSDLEVMGS
jgi:hypothetical protein